MDSQMDSQYEIVHVDATQALQLINMSLEEAKERDRKAHGVKDIPYLMFFRVDLASCRCRACGKRFKVDRSRLVANLMDDEDDDGLILCYRCVEVGICDLDKKIRKGVADGSLKVSERLCGALDRIGDFRQWETAVARWHIALREAKGE